MNPLTNMKNVTKLSEQELKTNFKTSWHDQYRNSAWIFIGGLPFDLSEGDVICIFSQYGEVVNINLIREKDTGKSRGFGFLCYEDQRSTDLAVDNFNGIKILGRTVRVDHVQDYKVPKEGKKTDQVTKQLYKEGCAPKPTAVPTIKMEKTVSAPPPTDLRETLADQIISDIRLPPRLPIYTVKDEPMSVKSESPKRAVEEEKTDGAAEKPKKHKKKTHKKKKKKRSKAESSNSGSDDESKSREKRRKK